MTVNALIPLRFYTEFTKRDWPRLPQRAQDALASFLLKLQKDSNDREILAKAEQDRTGRLSCEFSPGYVVYWQAVSELAQPAWIEVLAVLGPNVEFSDSGRLASQSSDSSTEKQEDSTQKVYSRTIRQGNLTMWGSLHASQGTGKIAGWIVDSWSDSGPPYLQPKLHWVSFPDHKLYHMQLNIDFKSTIVLGPEDTDVDPVRLIFVRAILNQWEQDWLEEKIKTTS